MFTQLQFENLQDIRHSNGPVVNLFVDKTLTIYNVTYCTSIIVSTIFENFIKSASESSEFWDDELSCESRVIDHHVLPDTPVKTGNFSVHS